MTDAEKIAYLRSRLLTSRRIDTAEATTLSDVCDIAERALLTDHETEAVRDDLVNGALLPITRDVLRRLLHEEIPVKHLLSFVDSLNLRCSCGKSFGARSTDAVIKMAFTHVKNEQGESNE